MSQGNFETLEDDVASLEDMETESEEAGDKLRLSSTKSRLYLDCLNSAAEGEYTCVAETPYMRKTQSTIVKVSKWPQADHVADKIPTLHIVNTILHDSQKLDY